MHFMYEAANWNGEAAQKMHNERFAGRQLLNRQTFECMSPDFYTCTLYKWQGCIFSSFYVLVTFEPLTSNACSRTVLLLSVLNSTVRNTASSSAGILWYLPPPTSHLETGNVPLTYNRWIHSIVWRFGSCLPTSRSLHILWAVILFPFQTPLMKCMSVSFQLQWQCILLKIWVNLKCD